MAGEGGGDFGSQMKRLMAERVEARKRRRGEAELPGPMGDTSGPPGTVGDAPGPPGPVPLGLVAAVSPQLLGHPPTAQGDTDAIAASSLVAKIARKVR